MAKTNVEAIFDFRRNRKSNLIKVAGGKCNICGYNKCVSALEFHHINPDEKSYGISQDGNCRDIKRDLEEVSKCILVCANCHREIHSELHTEHELLTKRLYDGDIAQSLITQKNVYRCNNCGKELWNKTKSGLCQKCCSEKHRVVKRPSREQLKHMIRTQSFRSIGDIYSVSDNSIRKWCKYECLPTNKKEINSYSEEEWIFI